MRKSTAHLLAIGFILLLDRCIVWAQKYELKLPGGRVERFNFEERGIEEWRKMDGCWSVEDSSDAPSGKRELVQRAATNDFNVIVAPGGPYSDVDVSVRFKPISGCEDASGGIVFRFSEGRYYLVRANALEDNFRLYYYDRGRYQLATARVPPPALANGTRYEWSLSANTSRPISTGNCCLIIETRVFARARSVYGQRRIA